MSTVSTTTDTTDPYAAINGTGSSSTKNTSSIANTKDQFLKLLITQLQTQDPLNPMDNAQMTSQLAQISTVEGLEKLNASMAALSSSYATSQSYAAASMISKIALVQGSAMKLGPFSSAEGASLVANAAVNLPNGADSVEVNIFDADGNKMKTVTVGKQSAGIMHFGWDGKLDDGTTAAAGEYSFTVTAKQGGNTTQATALNYAQIVAVTWDNGTPKMVLSNDKKVGIEEISELI